MNIYAIPFNIEGDPQEYEVFFNSKELAERFHHIVTGMLNEKGKDKVTIGQGRIVPVVTSEAEIEKSFKVIL